MNGYLKTIGSRDTLLAADRLFATCDAGNYMPAHYWAKDAEEFSGALPVPLSPKSATTVPLIVAGPLTRGSRRAETELRLDFTGLAESDRPTVAFNSRPLGKPARVETAADVRRFRYTLPSDAARTGRNEIRLEASSDTSKLAGAELWVR